MKTDPPFSLDLQPNAASGAAVTLFGVGATFIADPLQPGPHSRAISAGGRALKDGTPTTGPPAWLAAALSITNRVNFIQFEASFTDTSVAEGLLTIYWNTNQMGMVDERVVTPGLKAYRFALPETVSDGLYTLSFRLDAFGQSVASLMVTNVATGFVGLTEPIVLGLEGWTTNNLPILRLTATAGYNYLVQSSTNFNNWMPAALLVNTNGTVIFADPAASNSPARFYRAVVP